MDLNLLNVAMTHHHFNAMSLNFDLKLERGLKL